MCGSTEINQGEVVLPGVLEDGIGTAIFLREMKVASLFPLLEGDYQLLADGSGGFF